MILRVGYLSYSYRIIQRLEEGILKNSAEQLLFSMKN